MPYISFASSSSCYQKCTQTYTFDQFALISNFKKLDSEVLAAAEREGRIKQPFLCYIFLKFP